MSSLASRQVRNQRVGESSHWFSTGVATKGLRQRLGERPMFERTAEYESYVEPC